MILPILTTRIDRKIIKRRFWLIIIVLIVAGILWYTLTMIMIRVGLGIIMTA